jgi:hypothetical protein
LQWYRILVTLFIKLKKKKKFERYAEDYLYPVNCDTKCDVIFEDTFAHHDTVITITYIGSVEGHSVKRLGYGLDDRGSIPGMDHDGIFSLRHRAQTGSEPHPVVIGDDSFLPGNKVAGKCT